MPLDYLFFQHVRFVLIEKFRCISRMLKEPKYSRKENRNPVFSMRFDPTRKPAYKRVISAHLSFIQEP